MSKFKEFFKIVLITMIINYIIVLPLFKISLPNDILAQVGIFRFMLASLQVTLLATPVVIITAMVSVLFNKSKND